MEFLVNTAHNGSHNSMGKLLMLLSSNYLHDFIRCFDVLTSWFWMHTQMTFLTHNNLIHTVVLIHNKTRTLKVGHSYNSQNFSLWGRKLHLRGMVPRWPQGISWYSHFDALTVSLKIITSTNGSSVWVTLVLRIYIDSVGMIQLTPFFSRTLTTISWVCHKMTKSNSLSRNFVFWYLTLSDLNSIIHMNILNYDMKGYVSFFIHVLLITGSASQCLSLVGWYACNKVLPL